MELFDSRLMQLLSFLTRRQAWLTPEEICRSFRLDGVPITARTIHRWFRFLRDRGGFVYYPYPRANALGLQDTFVRVRSVRRPEVFGILPFASSFNVEVELGSGEPFVSQSYWVPGPAVHAFQDFWRAARDLGYVGETEILRVRNTHYIFSPFERLITGDGNARLQGPVDNRYFAGLIRRDLKASFELRISERIARAPLIIPIVVEHIWAHYSSRQVWQAIRSLGEARIRDYGQGILSKKLDRPGAALRLLQRQWTELLRSFDEVFLQPRVFLDWNSLRNAVFVSILMRPQSSDKMLEAVLRASGRSISTALKPGLEFDDRCHISCFIPLDQLLALHEVVPEYHRGREPASVAVTDWPATLRLFQPTFCKLDWRLFDPSTLSWHFEAERYAEQLKGLAA